MSDVSLIWCMSHAMFSEGSSSKEGKNPAENNKPLKLLELLLHARLCPVD